MPICTLLLVRGSPNLEPSLQAYGTLMALKDQASAAVSATDPDPAVAEAAAAALCPFSSSMSLEALARLSWSDDEVRELLAASGKASVALPPIATPPLILSNS